MNYIRERIVEGYLNRFAYKPVVEEAPWHISREEMKKITIRWPMSYQWPAASDWVGLLVMTFKKLVRVEMVDDIAQDYKGTVMFQVSVGGSFRSVAIGYSDYLPIDENCAKLCDLYFKMQFEKDGYRDDHIVPGGYVPDGKRLYFYLRRLRRLRASKTYQYDVYGRFGLNQARDIREKAIDILAGQQSFLFEGGMSTVDYLGFLQEVAKSRICIDLPGIGDFCFRLVNYLAIGSCIVAFPHRTMLHFPLVDRKHIIYCKEDFSDLTDLCQYYLENDQEREEIGRNAREYFDSYLHKDNLAQYYLRTCLERLV